MMHTTTTMQAGDRRGRGRSSPVGTARPVRVMHLVFTLRSGGMEHGVVKKSGAWFTFDQDQLGQGRENAKRFLRENPEVAMQLQAKVFELVGLTKVEAEEGLETAETSESEAAGSGE